ncbi:scavenger receptor class B member 1 [Anopheles nili]|uniref:scavenger receptor class B member 1 n=1 Tax=Anopheles nili TaxID=185578 RepID=UPI00237BA787|nr:scavenger receptor class B member 1 [Anopheles nili]
MTTTPAFSLVSKKKRVIKLCCLGVLFIMLAYAIIVIDPTEVIVEDKLSMYEGSYLNRLWKKPPLEVFISIYVFNVTNPEAFMRGEERLRVQEVGPYVYQEFLEHRNSTFNPNGTLSFVPVRRQVFVPERSVGDPKEDRIMIPNIALLGVSSAAYRMSAFAAFAVAAALKPLGMAPILNITTHDLLWGYDDPLVRIASSFLPDIIHFQKLGILDRMFDDGFDTVTINLPESVRNQQHLNDDISDELVESLHEEYYQDVTVQSTKKEPIRDYSIDMWSGSPGLAHWGYVAKDHWDAQRRNTPCNTLQGSYDGSVFPRNISKTEVFKVYRKAFCRTLPIAFEREGDVDGIKAYWFSIQENAFESSLDDPYTSCYCKNNQCLPKGLGDLSPCWYNIPVAVSLPHFYKGDPSLSQAIDGLSPDKAKHDAVIIMQPQLGIPMKANIRVQISLLTNISFNSELKPFHNTVIPLIWAEMSLEKLTPELILLLNLLFGIAPYLQMGFVCVLALLGVSLLATAALVLLCSTEATTFEYDPRKSIRYSTVNMIPYPLRKELEKYGEGEIIRREPLLIENGA